MYEYSAEIVYIVDGDTVDAVIDLGFGVHITQRLRLSGINTPEVRGPEREAGLAAEEHLKLLIDQNKPITILTEQDKRGKFGRYLATLIGRYPESKNINEQMIQDGHAKLY